MSNYFRLWFAYIKYLINRIITIPNVKLKQFMRYAFFQRIFDRELMSLDIGCGVTGKGLVNTDLFINAPLHRSGGKIDTGKYENFILCDIHNLPFRSKTFKCSRLIHVLEHLINPINGLKEISRVAEKLYLCVPSPINKFTDNTKTHYYTWNQNTLNNIMKLSFRNVRVILTPYELIGMGS